jgi:hypothetical protein
MTDARESVESARVAMMEAREAVEDYEKLHGRHQTPEKTKLQLSFTKASSEYLRRLNELPD